MARRRYDDPVLDVRDEARAVEEMLALLQLDAPALKLDPELAVIVSEGETNLVECVEALRQKMRDLEGIIAASTAARKKMLEREGRLERGLTRMREAIVRALEVRGGAAIRLAGETIFYRKPGKPKVVITHRASVPERFVIRTTRTVIDETLDMERLEAAVADGEHVPGVALDNPKPGCSFRGS